MKKNFFKVITAAVLLFSMAGITPALADVTTAPGDFKMTVFHTNDTHANLKNFAERAALTNKLRT